MKRYIFSAAIIVCLLSAFAAAFGQTGRNMPRPLLQRHAVMGSLAAHMKAIRAAIASNDKYDVMALADAIHWLARMLPDTFPKGSGREMGKTRAEPKIWSDWEGFVVASDRLAETADALKKTAADGNAEAIEEAFRIVARKGCGDCHKAYRTPKR